MDEFRIPKSKRQPTPTHKAGDHRPFDVWRTEEMAKKRKTEREWKQLTRPSQREDKLWCTNPPRTWTPAPKRFVATKDVSVEDIVGPPMEVQTVEVQPKETSAACQKATDRD